MLIIPDCKLRNKTGASSPSLQSTDCVKRGREDVQERQQVQAWGSTESTGSSVRSSMDSEANITLVVPPVVPIYGWLAPATCLLSLLASVRDNEEGGETSDPCTDLLFGKANLPSVLS